MNLYAEAVRALTPDHISHNNSDLYILMSHSSAPLIHRYRSSGGTVHECQDSDTQLYWYYIPWGYVPYWQKRMRFLVENLAWRFIDANEQSGKLFDWSNENFEKSFKQTMKRPPHSNLYPHIRRALSSILSPDAA